MADPPLSPELYAQLRAIAERVYAQRGFGHQSVQPTMLLHEAWLKIERSSTTFKSRAHFMAVAAQAMRQILVDRAKARGRDKRGANPVMTTLSGVAEGQGESVTELLALDEALSALAALDAEAARIVQLRAFGGLTVPEVAEVTGIPARTIARRWKFARAFLAQHLGIK